MKEYIPVRSNVIREMVDMVVLGAALSVGCIFVFKLSIPISIAIGVVVAIIALLSTKREKNMRVTVDSECLTVYTGSKVKHKFNLNSSVIKEGSYCTLYIKAPKVTGNNKEICINLKLLGQGQFEEILADLGIDNDAPIKLQATKKGKM